MKLSPLALSAFWISSISVASAFLSANLPKTKNNLKMVNTEKTIADLGIELPPPPPPAANYVPIQTNGDLLFMSGHIPFLNDGSLLTGKVGSGGKSVDEGYQAARQVALNLISSLKNHLGDLDRVEQVVKCTKRI